MPGVFLQATVCQYWQNECAFDHRLFLTGGRASARFQSLPVGVGMTKFFRWVLICFALAACHKEEPSQQNAASAPQSVSPPGAATAKVPNWVKSADIPENRGAIYYDAALIGRAGDVATLWRLLDYTESQTTGSGGGQRTYRSQKYQDEVDCTKAQSRTVKVMEFAEPMGRGATVGEFSTPGGWQPLSSESPYFRIACGKG